MVSALVDAQRPMHRSAHGRKAGDCVLKKKKQIRAFMQLEMIWIMSAHTACTILIFRIFLFPIATCLNHKLLHNLSLIGKQTYKIRSDFFFSVSKLKSWPIKCADLNMEDG